MNTRNHFAGGKFTSLIDRLERFHDAGIDPAFDADCEELERQFAELRLTFSHD